MEVQYVWNRSSAPLDQYGIPNSLRLEKLEDAPSLGADIVIEVSHPDVSKQLAVSVMQSGGNFVVGSPTALADHNTELSMREVAAQVHDACLSLQYTSHLPVVSFYSLNPHFH